ncbi:PCNA-interacting partner isoform X2 [Gouania willdenowi]|uniref:PCNA-interacting partner isoform X2 n=1 Tax=Gouania willdenowi TaxID=441366 RepID=UPI0010542BB6|nr:PCNA-interacting partner isoform X2 [Gouania willdenowi]
MEDCVNVLKLMMKTFRRESHRVLSSERTTVLGADGMLMVLQLVMAEINKQISLFEFLSGNHEVQEPPATPHTKPHPLRSQVKMAVRRVFFSYLSLLVNTKDDMALAMTLDVPSRSLGRQAFTDVKHAARDSNTSLFLAVTSFIRAVQLGGKGYAPSESHPLRKHLKGLTLFVHFLDSLEEILGETPDPSVCGARLLAAIRAALLKGRSSEDEVYAAAEETSLELKERMRELQQKLTTEGSNSGISPARPKAHAVNHATALGGRDTVKLLMALLDEEATAPPCANKAELLSEDQPVLCGAERTCMLSLFRSPEVSTGSSPEPLKNRVQSRINLLRAKRTDRVVLSQFSITYREHDDDLPLNRVLDFPSSSQTPTCVHPAPKPRPSPAVDVDTPTAEAQQEVVLVQRSGNALKAKTGKGSTAGSVTTVKGNKRKQTSKDGAENEPPEKKRVTGASVKPNQRLNKASSKKKLITGQGTLTSFFRV